jgi:hypothetical protein
LAWAIGTRSACSTYTLSGTFRSQGSEHLRHALQGQGQLSNHTLSGNIGLPRIREHFLHGLLEQSQLSNYALSGTCCLPGGGEYFRHARQGQGQLSNYTLRGTFGLPSIS